MTTTFSNSYVEMYSINLHFVSNLTMIGYKVIQPKGVTWTKMT